MCDALVEVREVQFETSCVAMPQDHSVTRQAARQLRHARRKVATIG